MAAAEKALSEEVGVLVEEDALRDVVEAKERPQGEKGHARVIQRKRLKKSVSTTLTVQSRVIIP